MFGYIKRGTSDRGLGRDLKRTRCLITRNRENEEGNGCCECQKELVVPTARIVGTLCAVSPGGTRVAHPEEDRKSGGRLAQRRDVRLWGNGLLQIRQKPGLRFSSRKEGALRRYSLTLTSPRLENTGVSGPREYSEGGSTASRYKIQWRGGSEASE